jgi:hypothetical protein
MTAILAISPTAHADMIGVAPVQARVWWSLVRSVPSPVGSSADFLVGLSGALRWRAAHAGRIITSAAIAAIIGEQPPLVIGSVVG